MLWWDYSSMAVPYWTKISGIFLSVHFVEKRASEKLPKKQGRGIENVSTNHESELQASIDKLVKYLTVIVGISVSNIVISVILKS